MTVADELIATLRSALIEDGWLEHPDSPLTALDLVKAEIALRDRLLVDMAAWIDGKGGMKEGEALLARFAALDEDGAAQGEFHAEGLDERGIYGGKSHDPQLSDADYRRAANDMPEKLADDGAATCRCPSGSYNPGAVHEPYCPLAEDGAAVVEHRENIVEVYDHRGHYLGCMGIETWRRLLLGSAA